MVKSKNLLDHCKAIQDLLRCKNCQSALTLDDDNYVCPNSQDRGNKNCHIQPVNAEAVVRAAVSGLITRVMTPQAASDLIKHIHHSLPEEATETARKHLIPGTDKILPSLRRFARCPPMTRECAR